MQIELWNKECTTYRLLWFKQFVDEEGLTIPQAKDIAYHLCCDGMKGKCSYTDKSGDDFIISIVH